MPDADTARPSSGSLILIPAVITLAVTLLRLAGELLHWSPVFFNPAPGGGFALVGISWLVPIFAVYFGVKLARAGHAPRRAGRDAGLLLLCIVLLPAAGFAASAMGLTGHPLRLALVFAVVSVATVLVALQTWPELTRTLLAYAFAARVPVALLMLFAILGNWGTHYDVVPPGFPALPPLSKWLWIGALPQLTVWIWYTVLLGGLFGLAAGVIAARGRRAEPA
jgi:hypothetical protein